MANETGAEREFLKLKYGKHARLLNVEEEEDICELMREYKDSCTKELSARCEKQVMCPHEHTRGGNDYMECVDCELEWDYRKENPPIIEARRRAEKAESEVRELRARLEKLSDDLAGEPL